MTDTIVKAGLPIPYGGRGATTRAALIDAGCSPECAQFLIAWVMYALAFPPVPSFRPVVTEGGADV